MRDLMELIGAETLAHWIDRWGSTLVVLAFAFGMGWMMYRLIVPVWEQIVTALELVK